MGLKSKILYCLILFSCGVLHSQSVVLSGNVIAEDDVEGIHILNKSNNQNTVTNQRGAFEILAGISDTLEVSGIMYDPIKIIVSAKHINDKYIAVRLDKKINLLDEVIVGKILTGSLDSDISNTETETLDLQKLGVPGYYGKQLTQAERRLADATGGKNFSVGGGMGGAGVGFNLNPFLNRISGRTKKLKNHVVLDNQRTYIEKLKSQYSDQLFENHNLTEGQKNEFFYYCSDNEEFNALIKQQNDALVLNFLLNKLESFNHIITNKQ